jgi:hypothetical protein
VRVERGDDCEGPMLAVVRAMGWTAVVLTPNLFDDASEHCSCVRFSASLPRVGDVKILGANAWQRQGGFGLAAAGMRKVGERVRMSKSAHIYHHGHHRHRMEHCSVSSWPSAAAGSYPGGAQRLNEELSPSSKHPTPPSPPTSSTCHAVTPVVTQKKTKKKRNSDPDEPHFQMFEVEQ